MNIVAVTIIACVLWYLTLEIADMGASLDSLTSAVDNLVAVEAQVLAVLKTPPTITGEDPVAVQAQADRVAQVVVDLSAAIAPAVVKTVAQVEGVTPTAYGKTAGRS